MRAHEDAVVTAVAGLDADREAGDRAPEDEGFDAPLPLVLPELTVVPDAQQVFMFSAITWNRHRIHYSRDAAQREGLPDIVVQRGLIGNFFARHAQRWMGAAGSVRRLAWQVHASAFPGQALHCRGAVTERLSRPPGDSDVWLRLQSRLEDTDGRLVASAEGELCIHAPF
jgi:acyl dehydratase